MILEAMFAYVALSAMGLAAILAVVHFLARLWWHASRGFAPLVRGVRTLTVQPPPGHSVDSREVWPMPEGD
ncbi:hypothetical protein ACQP08_29290 [Micromonospora zamorensis]|uniref:hypothetical protein n=1 Tax=Micromonospora zamorensis TaxID=709883 RepID=UPI003D8B594D